MTRNHRLHRRSPTQCDKTGLKHGKQGPPEEYACTGLEGAANDC